MSVITIEQLDKEIAEITTQLQQHEQLYTMHLAMYHKADGALQALQTLRGMLTGEAAVPTMTEEQFVDAINGHVAQPQPLEPGEAVP